MANCYHIQYLRAKLEWSIIGLFRKAEIGHTIRWEIIFGDFLKKGCRYNIYFLYIKISSKGAALVSEIGLE